MTTTRVSDDSGSGVVGSDSGRSSDPTRFAAEVIEQRLGEVRRRQTGVRLARGALITVAVFVLAMLLAMFVDARLQLLSTNIRSALTYTAFSLGAVAFVWLVVRPLIQRRGYVDVARQIEQDLPDLEERWSSVESLSRSKDVDDVRGSTALIRQVAREAVDLEPLVRSEQLAPVGGLRRPAIALAAVLAIMLLALLVDYPRVSVLLRRFWSPSSPVSFVQINAIPGETLVAVGEPLQLQAELSPRFVESATIMIRNEDGAIESLDMLAAAADAVNESSDAQNDKPPAADQSIQTFEHRIRKVKESFDYRIRAGDAQTDWYRVTAAQRPRVTDVQLQITPPTYTNREPVQHDELPRHVRVVEGSTLHVALRADMPLDTAQLELDDNDVAVDLTRDADGWYHADLEATESFQFTPHTVSEQGLANGPTQSCRVTVFKDRAPTVDLVAPDEDVSVRPDDTVKIEFEARDDFGVSGAELVVRKVAAAEGEGESDELTTIPIPLDDQVGNESVTGAVELDLSQFKLAQGDQLEYAVRVRDTKNLAANSTQPRMAQAQPTASDGSSDAAPSEPNAETPETAAAKLAATEPTESQSATGQSNPSPTEPNDTSQANSNPASAKPSQASSSPSPKEPNETSQANNNPSTKPNETSQANSTPSANQPNETSQANSNRSQSGQSSSQPSPAAPGKVEDSKGEIAGTPRPPDKMTRRAVDVPQSGTSSSLRLTIDQWAGSFAGQARHKLQIAIQPYIDQLQRDLEQAQTHTTTLTGTLANTGRWTDAEVKTLDEAQDHLKSAVDAIDELQSKTAETPYAFIGLQLVDIGQAHVGPALAELLKEIDPDRKVTERHDNIDQARNHIIRAREMLAALLEQYEEVRRNEQIAEKMQLVKTMYEVFVEDTFGMLRQNSGTLNPKGRKMAEYELDQQFLDDLTALLEKRRDLQAELARILADDPRLLRRLMAITTQKTNTLRDQMTRLAWQQEAVLVNLQRWKDPAYLEPPRDASVEVASAEVAADGAPESDAEKSDSESTSGDEAAAEKINDQADTADQGDAESDGEDNTAAERQTAKMRRVLAVADWERLSRETATLAENFATWSPLDLDGSEPLAKAGESAQQISVVASRVRQTAATGDYERTLAEMRELYTRVQDFQKELPQLVDAHPDHQRLLTHVTNRLAELNKIGATARSIYRKVQWMHRGRAYRVAEVDQQRVTAETGELASRLEGLDALLPQQVSDEVRELAKKLQATVNDELQVNQLSALYALREERDDSPTKIQQAIDSFAKAEKQFNELIDKAIEELDELPVPAPMVGDDPTLDELLALLENELNQGDPLGIPPRPNNLQVWFDFIRPGGGMSAMAGALAGAQASQTKAAAEKIQQNAAERGRAAARNPNSDGSADELAGPTEVRWNTLVSQLEDGLRQGRGTLPPPQYRRAIQQYFKTIAGRRQANE